MSYSNWIGFHGLHSLLLVRLLDKLKSGLLLHFQMDRFHSVFVSRNFVLGNSLDCFDVPFDSNSPWWQMLSPDQCRNETDVLILFAQNPAHHPPPTSIQKTNSYHHTSARRRIRKSAFLPAN